MWSRVIQSSFKATLLKGPKGKPDAKALGLLDGIAVGTPARGAKAGLCWWPAGEVAQPIAIEGFKQLACNTARVRIAAQRVKNLGSEAVVIARSGDAFVATSLHLGGWSETVVRDSDGEHHVGWGTTKQRRHVALLWSGGTTIELGTGDHPVANAVARGIQVGADVIGGNHHAMLWRGSAESAVDLHPAGESIFQSEATATDGEQQVGSGLNRKAENRALLWHGSAASCVDLTPSYARSAVATACSHGIQVGYVQRELETDRSEAVLWAGPDVVVSLHELVPAPYTTSAAWAVAVHGDRLLIAGGCMEYVDRVNRGERAVLWEARLE